MPELLARHFCHIVFTLCLRLYATSGSDSADSRSCSSRDTRHAANRAARHGAMLMFDVCRFIIMIAPYVRDNSL